MYTISIKGKTQEVVNFDLSHLSQVSINPRRNLIQENLVKLRASEIYPPLTIGKFGEEYFLTDGYHRKAIYDERGVTTAEAIIYEYTDVWDMKTDAYAMNINHGERLSDEEIADGVYNKYQYYIDNGKAITFEELGKEFAMHKRMVNSFVRWVNVKNTLGIKDIPKSKAEILARFDIDVEVEKTKMQDFWNMYNKLSVNDMRTAYDLFIQGKDWYKESLNLITKIDAVNAATPQAQEQTIKPSITPNAPIETLNTEYQQTAINTVAIGEENVEQLNAAVGNMTPTKIEVKAVIKNLIKNFKDTNETLLRMKENGQVVFCSDWAKFIDMLKLETDKIENFADEGWIDEMEKKAAAEAQVVA